MNPFISKLFFLAIFLVLQLISVTNDMFASTPEKTYAAADALYIWVSPDGDDNGDGSELHPYATLEKALSVVREKRAAAERRNIGQVHIVMRGGVYRLTHTLNLSIDDSGTLTSPTTIEAASGEIPIISGGVLVDGWHDAGSVPGLPSTSVGNVWVTSTPVLEGAPVDFRHFWVNGTKMRRASTLDDLSLPRLISVNKSRGELITPIVEQTFQHPDKLEMSIIQDWAWNNLRVKSLNNSSNRSTFTFMDPESGIEFKRPWPILRADQNSFSNHKFYLSNAIELLNRPQEWYNDSKEGKLYYWPRSGENQSDIQSVVPVLETLINIKGAGSSKVTYINFNGIYFEHTTWMRPSVLGHVGLQAGQFLYDAYSDDSAPGGNVAWVGRPSAAISVSDARNVTFKNCVFQHLGSTGLDFVSGTKRMTVQGCVFNDIGGTGILGGYFGDEEFESHMAYNPTDKTVVCDSLTISNNYITKIGNEDWGCVAIGIGYASNVTISHNEIYDTPYSAISLGWGWTTSSNCMRNNHITANYIHNFSNQMRDSGAIYTLSSQSNSSIENNRIEDVGDPLLNPIMWDMRHSQFDLYLDEGSDYFTVSNNWLERGEISRNQNGSHNTWGTNNNSVSTSIKNSAGLQAAYTNIRNLADQQSYAPMDSIGDDNRHKTIIDFVAQNDGFKQGNALAVDLNQDNRLDIVYGGGESNQVQEGGIRMNTGNYSFAATQGLRRLKRCNFAAGDLNGDGTMDLIQAGWAFDDNYNALWLNDGHGRLTERRLATSKKTSPACGISDLNNDGLSDCFFVGNGKDNNFYYQYSNHTFGDPVSSLVLPGGFSDPSMVYADFNNDQSTDICLLSNQTGGVYTRIFYNDGEGHFTETEVGFIERGAPGGMTYADVNHDGYLDIAIGGLYYGEQWNSTSSQGGKTVTLYINDQHGGFTKKQQFSEYLLDNVTQPLRFCDWDNDGDYDLIITGWNMSEGNVSRTNVFLNDGSGNFTKSSVSLPGVSESSVELADFGNNGVNDILITGNCNSGYNGFSGDRRIAVLCRNQTEVKNTSPTSPTNLKAELTGTGSVDLSWDSGSDSETNINSLSYNYYIRDLSSGLYMTFPNADITTGTRWVSQMGNAGLNKSWKLRNLPSGTYAWSVQTIDAAYAGSPFAPEQTFTVVDGAVVLDPVSYPESTNSSNLQLYQYLVESRQMYDRGITSMGEAYRSGASVYNNPSKTNQEISDALNAIKSAITSSELEYEIGIPGTYGIVNPGFENITSQHNSSNSAPFGWTLTRNGSKVSSTSTWYWFGANTDGTENEGSYVWGIWNGSNYGTIELSQTLSGLPNGLWKLTARLMNNNTESGNLARIFAGNSSMVAGGFHNYNTLPSGEQCNFGNSWATSDFDLSNVMSVYTIVNDNTLTIGVRTNGFFKVDDFQLTYLGEGPCETQVGVGSSGYATIVTEAPIDFEGLDGVSAFKVMLQNSASDLTFEKIDGGIAAGIPILIFGTPGETYSLPVTTSAVESVASGNILRVVNRPINGGTNIYAFGEGVEGTGFYSVASSVELAHGDVYLQASAGGRSFLPIHPEYVNIEDILNDASDRLIIYNLSGQRLQRPQRGVNIINGRKVIVR